MIESSAGQAPGCRILRLTGPLTLNGLFDFQSRLRADPPPMLILDLAGVPYMDSAGMGAIVNYFVSCQRAGRKMIVTGVRTFALANQDWVPHRAIMERLEIAAEVRSKA